MKKLMISTVAAGLLSLGLFATPAMAADWHHGHEWRGHEWHEHWHPMAYHPYYRPPVVAYGYAPAPVVYPQPVYYAPAPTFASFSFRIR